MHFGSAFLPKTTFSENGIASTNRQDYLGHDIFREAVPVGSERLERILSPIDFEPTLTRR